MRFGKGRPERTVVHAPAHAVAVDEVGAVFGGLFEIWRAQPDYSAVLTRWQVK